MAAWASLSVVATLSSGSRASQSYSTTSSPSPSEGRMNPATSGRPHSGQSPSASPVSAPQDGHNGAATAAERRRGAESPMGAPCARKLRAMAEPERENQAYEAPEIVDLGPIEDVTFGPTGDGTDANGRVPSTPIF